MSSIVWKRTDGFMQKMVVPVFLMNVQIALIKFV